QDFRCGCAFVILLFMAEYNGEDFVAFDYVINQFENITSDSLVSLANVHCIPLLERCLRKMWMNAYEELAVEHLYSVALEDNAPELLTWIDKRVAKRGYSSYGGWVYNMGSLHLPKPTSDPERILTCVKATRFFLSKFRPLYKDRDSHVDLASILSSTAHGEYIEYICKSSKNGVPLTICD